jgi:hypothetical protein
VLLLLQGVRQWVSKQLEQRTLVAAQERTAVIADGVNNGLNTLMDIRVDGKDVISDARSRGLFIQRLRGVGQAARTARGARQGRQ